MSLPFPPAPALRRPTTEWANRLVAFALVVGLGIVLGFEYLTPEKRSLSVLAALVVFGIAWRIDTLTGIGFMIIFLPFPRFTVFGSTNLAFLLLLTLIWTLRATLKQAPPPRRTALDVPVAGLVIAYVVSFYNIENNLHFARALENTVQFLATLLLFFLVVNNVRTDRQLIRLHRYQAIGLAAIFLLCIWELSHPGQALFKGWIEFRGTRGDVFNTKNVRIGGPFFDYELLAEFCGLNLVLILFWLLRARSLLGRLAYTGLLLMAMFTLFATVTRGAIVALALTAPYLAWRLRRRLNVVTLTILVAVLALVTMGMNYYVANFTRSGDVFARLAETQLIGGMPDSRAVTWPEAWERMMMHPIIGHGPYYAAQRGLSVWLWPHNVYLYVGNLVGFVGLFFFLWILFRMFAITRPRTDNPWHPSYAEAFLIVGNAQLLLFMVDQAKIEYLRNVVYPYQVWLMFASLVAAAGIAERQRRGEPEPA